MNPLDPSTVQRTFPDSCYLLVATSGPPGYLLLSFEVFDGSNLEMGCFNPTSLGHPTASDSSLFCPSNHIDM